MTTQFIIHVKSEIENQGNLCFEILQEADDGLTYAPGTEVLLHCDQGRGPFMMTRDEFRALCRFFVATDLTIRQELRAQFSRLPYNGVHDPV